MPPPWPEAGFASPADLATCRALLAQGSRSFHAASLLLPGRVRLPTQALYAFCRVADDLVDRDPDPAGGLDRLRTRLAAAYAGRPGPHPVDRAMADLAHGLGLPRALPEALLEGFAWDLEGRRYRDLPALRAYAARVAGVVGCMTTVLMGVRCPKVLARACDLGVAMQLTNIARDVGEDARAGRLYLPLAWLEEAGVEPEAFLARPAWSPPLAAVVTRLLAQAELLYARAAAGVPGLPAACRPAVHLARLLYAEIGRRLLHAGLDPVQRRTVVPAARKLALLPWALGAALAGRSADPAPPLPETAFLVEAAAAAPPPAEPEARGLVWVLELVARLERRDLEALGGTRP
jgi:phytoene synthase